MELPEDYLNHPLRAAAIATIEARVADYTTSDDAVNRHEGNPSGYIYNKLRFSWNRRDEFSPILNINTGEHIIHTYIRGIEDGRIDPENPLPHGEPNQHIPSRWN